MFAKIKAALALLRKGQAVADPKNWQRGMVTVGILAAFLGALNQAAKSFGFDLGLSELQLESAASAIVTLIGVYATIAATVCSKDIGLPASKSDQP